MLKGLKGILEKGLQIAAPFIGNMILPGAGGAMLGSGIASLLTGNKPKDALMSAGATYLSGIGQEGGSPLAKLLNKGKEFQVNRSVTDYNKKMRKDNFLDKAIDFGKGLFDKPVDGQGPSTGAQLLATGLPAYLSYLAAKEDANKGGPQDASEYMSATDKFYGGQFAPPPEDRRIKNLLYQGMGNDNKPIYANQGDVFPRKTGQIEGPGTKTSDSIPAMLSDGEFVQRTDAVNGAGVMMGATNAKEAREKGADFMYALQDKLAKMGQKVA